MSRKNLAAVLAAPARGDGPKYRGEYAKGAPIVTPHRLEKSRARAPEQQGAQRLAVWLGLEYDAGSLEIFCACEKQRDGHMLADAGGRS